MALKKYISAFVSPKSIVISIWGPFVLTDMSLEFFSQREKVFLFLMCINLCCYLNYKKKKLLAMVTLLVFSTKFLSFKLPIDICAFARINLQTMKRDVRLTAPLHTNAK